MAQPYQLVIDLGTCHTVAVVRRAGQPPRPLLFDGTPLLPSGVYRDADGTLSVGRDAERLSLLSPSRFEPYPKRCVDDGAVLLGDAPVPVVELLAALLRRVVAEAAPQEGTPREVTLTCPADWGPQRREVLRSAARAAGLPDVRLVDEPIAAATYCVQVLGQPIPVGRSMLVFDFGGGTLDVTVVRHDPDGLRVLSVGGLDDLGGVDVDAALVGHLGQLVALRQPHAWRRLVDPHSTGEQRDRRAFWNEVRAAKEMLSRVPSAPVQIPGSDDALHLTREELERVAGPLIDRAVDETRRVLDRAGLLPGTLAGILLVGGSSRIPLAASRLHARFGVAPTVPEQPELPVAYGALLLATPPPVTAPEPPGHPGLPLPPVAPPVSADPYRSSPVSGGAVWAPQPPRPVSPGPFAAPAAPSWTPPPVPPQAPARRRSPAVAIVGCGRRARDPRGARLGRSQAVPVRRRQARRRAGHQQRRWRQVRRRVDRQRREVGTDRVADRPVRRQRHRAHGSRVGRLLRGDQHRQDDRARPGPGHRCGEVGEGRADRIGRGEPARARRPAAAGREGVRDRRRQGHPGGPPGGRRASNCRSWTGPTAPMSPTSGRMRSSRRPGTRTGRCG